MCRISSLPKLEKEDYLNKDYNFWKNYRLALYKVIKEQEKEEQVPKTPENVIKMSETIGVKAAARYFNISPSSVRYYRNKLK